jgi:hypothetical protein
MGSGQRVRAPACPTRPLAAPSAAPTAYVSATRRPGRSSSSCSTTATNGTSGSSSSAPARSSRAPAPPSGRQPGSGPPQYPDLDDEDNRDGALRPELVLAPRARPGPVRPGGGPLPAGAAGRGRLRPDRPAAAGPGGVAGRGAQAHPGRQSHAGGREGAGPPDRSGGPRPGRPARAERTGTSPAWSCWSAGPSSCAWPASTKGASYRSSSTGSFWTIPWSCAIRPPPSCPCWTGCAAHQHDRLVLPGRPGRGPARTCCRCCTRPKKPSPWASWPPRLGGARGAPPRRADGQPAGAVGGWPQPSRPAQYLGLLHELGMVEIGGRPRRRAGRRRGRPGAREPRPPILACRAAVAAHPAGYLVGRTLLLRAAGALRSARASVRHHAVVYCDAMMLGCARR